jgi:hypothetical protein
VASAAARAITKIAKMSPFNWQLSNRSENVTRFRLIELRISSRHIRALCLIQILKVFLGEPIRCLLYAKKAL